MNSNGAATGAAHTRRSLSSAAAILMVSFILSRVLGLARVSLQAAVLGGTKPPGIAFTTAITIPDLIFTLVSGGALGSSFIPVFAGMIELGDEDRAWRVASGVMNGVLIVLLVAIGIAELAAPWIVAAMTTHIAGMPPDMVLQTRQLTLTLTRIMLLQPLFLAVSGILMGVYNSYHRFVVPALAPLVYNMANIVGLALVPVVDNTVALAGWGVTVGALLQIVVMLPGLWPFRARIGVGRGLGEPGTREVAQLMMPRVIGQAGIQLSTIVAIWLADNAVTAGPSADFRYAFNLMALPVGIFGSALATAIFPTLSGQAARGENAALGKSVSQTLRTMLFLSIPAGIGLIVLRYPITEVLYLHGRFGDRDVDIVTGALLVWGIGVPVMVAVELLPRAFFALKDTWTPVLVNLVTLATAVVLSIVGVLLTHGDSVAGIMVLSGAIALTVAIEVVWLGILLRRRVATLGLRELAMTALRSVVAGEAMGVALLALLYVWQRAGPGGFFGNLLLLIVAVPLGIAVYGGWAYVVEAPELAIAWAMIYARLKRSRQ